MDIQYGTFEGTGADIYVCLGRTPRAVLLFNVDDTTDYALTIWLKGMDDVAAIAGGWQVKTAAGAVLADLTAAQGIDEYAGGDKLVYDGTTDDRWEDASGDAVSGVYVDKDGNDLPPSELFPSPEDGEVWYTPAGFKVGTDAALNSNGETVVWLALFD